MYSVFLFCLLINWYTKQCQQSSCLGFEDKRPIEILLEIYTIFPFLGRTPNLFPKFLSV